MINSIYEISSRTRSKIIKRLNLGCFNCGWDKSSCDLHHILPKSHGGSDSHDNITYICPNCHRLAHEGKISKLVSFTEKIGDNWKKVYYPAKAGINPIKNKEIKNRNYREQLRIDDLAKINLRKEKILNSNIDFSKFGWVEKVASIIELSPQKVSNWMIVHMKEFYNMKCFRRKSKKDQFELFKN